MPSDDDLLFGKIALGKHFCSKEQIDLCLVIQSTGRDRIPLGRILVNEGYLSEDQHSNVLTLQRKNLTVPDLVSRRSKESVLFGKLAVREGLLSEADANECLRIQAADGEKRTLGEIMTSKGYLTTAQVRLLLAKQEKKLMSCPACRLNFTVLTISREKIACPRCKGSLEERGSGLSTRSDAEFATKTLQVATDQLPSGSAPARRLLFRDGPKVKFCCVVCDQPLEAILDSTGRVRCPSCRSSFVPKKK